MLPDGLKTGQGSNSPVFVIQQTRESNPETAKYFKLGGNSGSKNRVINTILVPDCTRIWLMFMFIRRFVKLPSSEKPDQHVIEPMSISRWVRLWKIGL